uniref:F-box associated domain-containing protein n=1 Tax=Fagus sylvatica TaxID=28930 RepID=A0A2N9GEV4_FAGSY
MPPPQNYLDGFLTEFKGLLALVVCGQDQDEGKCFIWVMREYGVVESWVKQIVPLQFISFFGCTNNGQVLIESKDDHKLCLFDPETLHENRLDVHHLIWAVHTNTFVESLVLLESGIRR